MKNKYAKKKQKNKDIASLRIEELFEQAAKWQKESQKKSDNCVNLARKISLKYKVPFSKAQKIRFCKKCSSFLTPGINSRTRVNKGRIIVLCQNCNNIMRYLYK